MPSPKDPDNRDPFDDPNRPPLPDPPSMTNPDGSPNRDFGSEAMEWHEKQLERVEEEFRGPGVSARGIKPVAAPPTSMTETNTKLDRIIELMEGILSA